MASSTSDAHRDAQVIKALFAALCTVIPEDVRLELLRSSSLELKFLTAVQPRVCSFSHRKRHSLRHPAMSMAVQRFYYTQRVRRQDEEANSLAQPKDRGVAQRRPSEMETDRINAMLADYASRGEGLATSTNGSLSGGAPEDGGWAEFGTSVSGSLWHYRRMSSINGGGSESAAPLPRSARHQRRSLSAGNGVEGALRPTSAVSESLLSVIKNSGHYVHLLELNDAAGAPGTSGLGSAGAGRKGSVTGGSKGDPGGFFSGKQRQQKQQQQQQQQRQGKRAKGNGNTIMPMLGMVADTSGPFGADDMEEEEEFVAYQQREDLRWEQIAVCYDEMLRAASAPCKLAAITAALNGMLNDVIRRFWDRVTVAPVAQERYQQSTDHDDDDDDEKEGNESEEKEDRDTDSEVGQPDRPEAMDENNGSPFDDDGREEPLATAASKTKPDGTNSNSEKGSSSKAARRKTSTTKRASSSSGAAGAKGKRGARGAADKNTEPAPEAVARRKSSAKGRAKRKSSAAAAGGAGRGSAGSGATKKKNRKGGKAGGRAGGTGGGTALYMSPLQYVYLHMRIANVLLPPGNDLEMEMLESVREDLLMDGAYKEDDTQLEHYYGKAPVLVAPPGVVPQRNPNPPEGQLMRPSGGLHHALRSTGRGAGGDGGSGRGRRFRWTDGMIGDHAESVGANSMFVGPSTVIARRSGDDSQGLDGGAAGPWDTMRMPWLSYAQFWHSMMELADNWTCSAANPVECTIFLFELYGDVFGHDWAEDDQMYFNMLKRKHTQAGADGERLQESLDVLASFREMVEDLEEMSGSESDLFMETHFGRHDSSTALSSPTRRRSTKLFSHSDGDRDDDTSDGDSDSSNSIDWTGQRKKDGWRYRRYLEEQTGEWKRVRRKTVLERSKKAKLAAAAAQAEQLQMQAQSSGVADAQKERGTEEGDNMSNEAGMESGSSEHSVYILEEELDADNQVIRRRRLHRHSKSASVRRKGSRSRRHRRSSAESDDLFMYDRFINSGDDEDDDSRGGRGSALQRKYYDKPPSRFRRLDNGQRKDDYMDVYDDDLSADTSWSSFADNGEVSPNDEGWKPFQPLRTEMERRARVRQRVRRTGPRSERRRFGRSPEYYYQDGFSSSGYDEESEDMLSSISDGINFSDYSYSVDEEEEVRPIRAAEEVLSDEQRSYLQEKKEWLQRMLAKKGVHISDAAFASREEEAVLYQLLMMTEKLAAKAAAAGRSFEDAEDIGIADFDAVLLAKLFAKPKTYTLEELQQSELMKMLLAMGEDGQDGKVPLSAAQMNGVLAALMGSRRSGGPPETASSQRRRENLIAEARRLQKALRQEERRRRAEAKAERARQREAELAAAAGTFGLTEVAANPESDARPSSRPTTGGRHRAPPMPLADVGDDIDDKQLMVHLQRPQLTPTPPLPRTDSTVLQRPQTSNWDDGDDTGDGKEGALPPLTRQERREQEKLFREFEAYCIEHAEQNSKYKIKFLEYTPEQLEAFFLALGLGPKQQALLRGRAPLAPATSSVGGNMHQQRGLHRKFLLGGGAVGMTAVSEGEGGNGDASPQVKLAPAPVKVFTLTTADSLEGAIRESYRSYMDDRDFQALLHKQERPRGHATFPSNTSHHHGTGGGVPAAAREAPGHVGSAKLPPLPAATRTTGSAAAPPQRHAAPRAGAHGSLPKQLPNGIRAPEAPPQADRAAPLPSRTSQLVAANVPGADQAVAPPQEGMKEHAVTPAMIFQRAAEALLVPDSVDSPTTGDTAAVAGGGEGALRGKRSDAVTPIAARLGGTNAASFPLPAVRGGGQVARAGVPSPTVSSKPKESKAKVGNTENSLSTTSSRGFDPFELDQ